MKITVLSQRGNTVTGLNKAVGAFIQFAKTKSDINFIDIIDNKLFPLRCLQILFLDTDAYYFTPAGSFFGILRDTFYLFFMIIKRKKVVLHFHNSAFGKNIHRSRTLFTVNKWLYSKVNKIILLGWGQLDMFEGMELTEDVFEVIPNSIDSDIFINDTSLETKFNVKIYNILFFSNMIEEKGYKIVLELAKKMKNDSNFHFYFSGKFFDSQLRDIFLEDVKHLKNLTYLDGTYGREKIELLQKCHYFILPSTYSDETLPISMLEAMAAANYIIVTDVGVIKNVLDKKNSHLMSSNRIDVSEILGVINKTKNVLSPTLFDIDRLRKEFDNDSIQERIYQTLK